MARGRTSRSRSVDQAGPSTGTRAGSSGSATERPRRGTAACASSGSCPARRSPAERRPGRRRRDPAPAWGWPARPARPAAPTTAGTGQPSDPSRASQRRDGRWPFTATALAQRVAQPTPWSTGRHQSKHRPSSWPSVTALVLLDASEPGPSARVGSARAKHPSLRSPPPSTPDPVRTGAWTRPSRPAFGGRSTRPNQRASPRPATRLDRSLPGGRS